MRMREWYRIDVMRSRPSGEKSGVGLNDRKPWDMMRMSSRGVCEAIRSAACWASRTSVRSSATMGCSVAEGLRGWTCVIREVRRDESRPTR